MVMASTMVIHRFIHPCRFTTTTGSDTELVFLAEFLGEAVAYLEGHLGEVADFLLEHRGVVEAVFRYISGDSFGLSFIWT